MAERPADGYIFDFLNTREGLELNRAFARISDPKSRRAILDLVRKLAGDEASAEQPVTPEDDVLTSGTRG
jgi:hypothetical protein